MPYIRGPSWRPRKIFGHQVEALQTTKNLDLECDTEFQQANLTGMARSTMLGMKLTAWFVRLPGEKKTFATLVKLDGVLSNYHFLKSIATYRAIPLTTDENPEYLYWPQYHYSFVDGRVQTYVNGNRDYLWKQVSDYLDWMAIPAEDRKALEEISDF
ncbi:hypothetical protein ASF60_13590 [Methylobacterium sp. Leaf113]|uniref:hypothetical protein n=1 Tax=Methylobacterium sp. Leaf113 TaxID=1736259 RepID=UPI0006F86A33|nr:hypothetical protein [Methylobacterium sp. Leaf113]KQP94132.1 hypothetical protein ASF60_13590 [Methylobacterium sp. Leaf113]